MNENIVPENYTSAQLDATRINCVTTQVLVSLDVNIPADRKAYILQSLEDAREYLDIAREALPAIITSVHAVSGGG